MEGSIEAKKQQEQLDKYLAWVKEEGGIEGPGHLKTWFKPQQQVRLKWLKRHCVGTVIELGCNYGFPLAYCEGQIGVDFNEKTIALAQILNPDKKFVVADIRKLPFPDGYVDTVLCIDVLEHLSWEDVSIAVSEAIRVARLRVLVTVPNGDNVTPEATSMKHRWLSTSERVNLLVHMFGKCKVKVLKDHFFVYIRADK